MDRHVDWDDLRLVLAITRKGSLSGAARALGVTHSTVFRRLGTMERRLGVRLFERFRDGYCPTAAGETAAGVAARFAEEILELERRFSGQDLRPTGAVRITTTDTIGVILTRHLPELRAAHPGINLEIVISDAMANLTRREADVAIRPTLDPPEILVGRRIAEIAHAIYGSLEYLGRHDRKALFARDWIGLDDVLAGTIVGRWLRKNVPEKQIVCRVNTLPALRDAALSGVGLALLPCYVGDIAGGLRRALQKTLPQPKSTLWLLTHDDIKRSARIRAVVDFLAAEFRSERALFEGRRPMREVR